MNAELDALIGAPAAPARRQRTKKPPAPLPAEQPLEILDYSDEPDSSAEVRQRAIRAAYGGTAFIDAGVLKRPVSRNFLAMVFDMDPATVTKRLVECRPCGQSGGGRPVYDFREAIQYLLPPKMDIAEYIRSVDPAELPNHINKFFWAAQRERLKFLREARQAWGTEEVLEVFGDVFMVVKTWMQLLPETMRERVALTDEQFAAMVEMGDILQNDIHEKLIDMPRRQQTVSLAAEFEDGESVVEVAE